MRKLLNLTIATAIAVPTLLLGQGADVTKILADAKQALGGDQKIAAVKTLTAGGRTGRVRPDGTSTEAEFELLMELPDKYMKRDVLMAMGPTSIYRNTGFNGDGLINLTDTPPALSAGGGIRMIMAGPGGGAPGQQITPEQMAEANHRLLVSYKQEFAKLTLGMFMSSFGTYPLKFTYAGQAESADGKADVIDVNADGDFKAKLFIDATTHMPLMLSWMEKEPLVVTMGPGGTSLGGGAGAGNVQVFRGGGPGGGGQPMSKEDMDKMQQEMAQRLKEAEARRQVVEYRIFYADYKTYDGVKLPTRIQRTINGKPSEEVTFDRIKLNAKIDPKKFEPTK
jgi:hypothetical protein